MIGRLFAYNHMQTQETDIILTLTPHIVRVLDLNAEDVRAFKVGRDGGATAGLDVPTPIPPPRPPRRPERPQAAPAGRRAAGTPALQPIPPRSRPGDAAEAAAAAVQALTRTDRGRPTDRTDSIRPSGDRISRDARAQGLQPLHQLAVAALDRLQRLDPALASRRQRRGNQRHARADVAAVERLAAQPDRPGDDDAVGSHRNRSAPMPLICSSANSRSSYIQSCTSVRPRPAWPARSPG